MLKLFYTLLTWEQVKLEEHSLFQSDKKVKMRTKLKMIVSKIYGIKGDNFIKHSWNKIHTSDLSRLQVRETLWLHNSLLYQTICQISHIQGGINKFAAWLVVICWILIWNAHCIIFFNYMIIFQCWIKCINKGDYVKYICNVK